MTRRDLALALLAGFVAVIYTAAVVILAVRTEVEGASALAALAPLGPLAGFAIGRMSGASGERPATTEG